MVESLLSVSATTIAKQLGAAEAKAEHPNDTYYKRLCCGLEPASAEEVAYPPYPYLYPYASAEEVAYPPYPYPYPYASAEEVAMRAEYPP